MSIDMAVALKDVYQLAGAMPADYLAKVSNGPSLFDVAASGEL